MDIDEMRELLLNRRPVRCSKCDGRLFLAGNGEYECKSCGNIEYDDFGKVKKYLEENPSASAIVVEAAIGVPRELIDAFLRRGRLEMPEGMPEPITCERCGCTIRSGRFCSSCIRQLAGGMQGAFSSGTTDRPRPQQNGGGVRMHFLDTHSGSIRTPYGKRRK